MEAITQQDQKTIKNIIRDGIDLNEKTSDGKTVLMHAVIEIGKNEEAHEGIVKLLVGHSLSDVLAPLKSRQPDHPLMAWELILRGENVEGINRAVTDLPLIALLLESKANPKIADARGNIPLNLIVQERVRARYLREGKWFRFATQFNRELAGPGPSGSDISFDNSFGESPLFIAFRAKDKDLFSWLVTGPFSNLLDNKGRHTFDWILAQPTSENGAIGEMQKLLIAESNRQWREQCREDWRETLEPYLSESTPLFITLISLTLDYLEPTLVDPNPSYPVTHPLTSPLEPTEPRNDHLRSAVPDRKCIEIQ